MATEDISPDFRITFRKDDHIMGENITGSSDNPMHKVSQPVTLSKDVDQQINIRVQDDRNPDTAVGSITVAFDILLEAADGSDIPVSPTLPEDYSVTFTED